MDDLAAETETILNKLRELYERKLSNETLTEYKLWYANTLESIAMVERVLRGMAEDAVDDNMYEALGDASDAIANGLLLSVVDYKRIRRDPWDIFFSAVMEAKVCADFEIHDDRDTILRSVCFSAMRTISTTESHLDSIASVKRVAPDSVVAAYDRIREKALDEQIVRAIDRYGDAFRVGAKTKAAR